MASIVTVGVFAFLLGVVTGLRSMLGIAAISWASKLGYLKFDGTPFAFLGFAYTPYILGVLAIGELIGDLLPMTPSRTAFAPFFGRVVLGASVGAALGSISHLLIMGLICGALGGVLGTLGGAAGRARLSAALGKDWPAALIEDGLAIVSAAVLVTTFHRF